MRLLACAAVVLSACATAPVNAPAPVPEPAPVPAPAAETQAPSTGLPFIQNDFASALKRGQAEGKPLFVDVWAPW